nr:polymerase delta-interacting protein 2-like isoform X2 [Halyomorpha halys]
MEILRKIASTITHNRLLKAKLTTQWVQISNYVRLAEVGRFELPKIEGDYEAGQLFLHAVFGYRGVVLFPWVARVYDRDYPHSSRHGSRVADENGAPDSRDVKGREHTFYQVLIDARDCPYIVSIDKLLIFAFIVFFLNYCLKSGLRTKGYLLYQYSLYF